MFFCVAAGLWGGLIIGLVTEYYTSNRYAPVQVGAGVCFATVCVCGVIGTLCSLFADCFLHPPQPSTAYPLLHSKSSV